MVNCAVQKLSKLRSRLPMVVDEYRLQLPHNPIRADEESRRVQGSWSKECFFEVASHSEKSLSVLRGSHLQAKIIHKRYVQTFWAISVTNQVFLQRKDVLVFQQHHANLVVSKRRLVLVSVRISESIIIFPLYIIQVAVNFSFYFFFNSMKKFKIVSGKCNMVKRAA